MIPTFFSLFAFYTVLNVSNNFNVLSVVHINPLYFNLFYYFYFLFYFIYFYLFFFFYSLSYDIVDHSG